MNRLIYVEVTNTLQAFHLTGIQRVTKRLLKELDILSDQIQLITYSQRYGVFRHLTKKEKSRLLSTHKSLSFRIPGQFTLTQIWRRIEDWIISKKRLIDSLEPGSIFLELEAAWHNPIKRDTLLPKLKSKAITPVVLHYDLIPIVYPEYVHPDTINKFRDFKHAHFLHTDHFLCISNWSKTMMVDYVKSQYNREVMSCEVIPMSPFQGSTSRLSKKSKKHRNHLLAVGTLEIRKNHEILLDVLEELVPEFPNLQLVLVGKPGWLAEEVINRIKYSPYLGNNLFWYLRLPDDELSALYQSAYLLIMPSLVEGFGLPVIEALSVGCPVVSSTGGALPEAGGDWVEYFEPNDSKGLKELIIHHLRDEKHHDLMVNKAKKYKAHSWNDSAQKLMHYINQI